MRHRRTAIQQASEKAFNWNCVSEDPDGKNRVSTTIRKEVSWSDFSGGELLIGLVVSSGDKLKSALTRFLPLKRWSIEPVQQIPVWPVSVLN